MGIFTSQLCLMLIVGFASGAASAAISTQLGDRGCMICIDAQGHITAVENRRTGDVYKVVSDKTLIETDSGVISLCGPGVSRRFGKSCAEFTRKTSGLTVTWRYSTAPHDYIDRTLIARNHSRRSVLIKRVVDCSLRFAKSFESFSFHRDGMDRMDEGAQSLYESDKPETYRTALNVFLRGKRGGLLAGLKYPYWTPELTGNSVTCSYEVNYRIKPGETLQLPAAFVGVYKKTGFTCRKELSWTPRIISTEQEAMDWGEVRAMQRVVRDYVKEENLPSKGYFIWLNAWWANRDLQGKLDEKSSRAYCALIDQIARSKCVNMLMIAPVWVGWAGFLEPAPEIDAISDNAVFPMNQHIEAVVDHAREVGVDLWGFCEPNALSRHYRADRPDWKLQTTKDLSKTLIQNCHANPEYEDWFYRLICSAIDTCGLKGWAWDHCWVRRPMVCWATTHGHEPGNCEFQQYKNVTELISCLRQRYPNYIFEVYWGLKEAGTWAHRGLNSLENLYENNSPAPPGMSAADDQRFQHWYNHNYRFLPTYTNLAQINFDKEANGHLYSILSVLSASTHASLADWKPVKSDHDATEVFGLLRYWKAWATRNMAYLKDRVDLFGQPCRKNGVDGTAHIIGDRGFIFVFNPWPDAHWGSVPLGEMIGLTRGTRFVIDEISTGRRKPVGVHRVGDDFVFEIPSRSALLFQITPSIRDVALRAPAVPAGISPQKAFVK